MENRSGNELGANVLWGCFRSGRGRSAETSVVLRNRDGMGGAVLSSVGDAMSEGVEGVVAIPGGTDDLTVLRRCG